MQLILLLLAVLLTGSGSESVRARSPAEEVLQERLLQVLKESSGQYNPVLGALGDAASGPRHMDLGLPDGDMRDVDSPLLLHLKDQGLWDKENGLAANIARRGIESSYIEALLTHLHQRAKNNVEDKDYESEKPAINQHSNLHLFPRVHLYQDKVIKDEDIEEVMKDDDESVKVTSDDDSGTSKSSMHFNLMDVFKKIYGKSVSNIETEAPNVIDSVAQDNAGMFFKLDTLERQLKEKYNADINDQSGEKPGMKLNLVDMLEQYVGEKLEKSDEGALPDTPSESDSNAGTSDNTFQD